MFSRIHGVAAFALVAAVSQATSLPPGGRVGRNNSDAPGVLDIFTESGTLLAQTTSLFNNASIQGSVLSAVFKESNGDLDFGVQVTVNAGSDPVHRITLYNYGLFTTDVGILNASTSPFPSVGTVLASEANRSSNGTVVGFDFDPSTTNGLNPGTVSFAMLIKTNATDFKAGNVGVIDGVTANVGGFAPVPEPASIAAISLGVLGLLRRKKK